jgi:hypothetical protein
MKKNIVMALVVFFILAGGITAYFYWQHIQSKPESKIVSVPPPALPPAAQQETVQIIAAPSVEPTLPKLAESDKFILSALAGLINNETLLSLFNTRQIIHNIVATIDNLPRKRMPTSVMPLKKVKESFITTGPEDEKVISPKNAARYAQYMKIAEVTDIQKLVELYVRLYPLFQEAYTELGYPKKYFNDRLLFVLDHLLATPDAADPIKLVRPSVFYQYADPDLEARSAGQKILLRIGNKNRSTIKAKLREIKQQVMLHVHEKKVDSTK